MVDSLEDDINTWSSEVMCQIRYILIIINTIKNKCILQNGRVYVMRVLE